MNLFVKPQNRVIDVQPGSNLLEVLREHSVPISYSCTSGRCGTCRCKIIEGQLMEMGQEYKVPNLNGDRHVLACQSVLIEACTIEIAEPDEVLVHPARIVKATVVAIEDLTHDIKRLRLRPSKPLVFAPGQYVQLQFTPQHARPYSMAGLCDDEELEFQIRLVPDGRVTTYIAGTLAVGDAVRVSGPMGAAYLRRKHEGPMLCIAGGSGLAPILSILRGALTAGMTNPIHLYFGVRSPKDLYGEQWLDALSAAYVNLHVHIVIAMGNDDPRRRSGLVTDAVAADWNSLAGWRAYLAGAPPMVEAATLLVQEKGLLPEHIHADAFYPSGT
jgi:ferredoxin-NAD(P)+ reductase (naphthalene dioxygenase ferredoxin-specific)